MRDSISAGFFANHTIPSDTKHSTKCNLILGLFLYNTVTNTSTNPYPNYNPNPTNCNLLTLP